LAWKQTEVDFQATILTFSPNQNLLACAGRDLDKGFYGYSTAGKFILLDARTGQVLHRFSQETRRDRLEQKRLSRMAAIGSKLGLKSTLSPIPKFLPGDSGTVDAIAFSPDGKTLAAGYADGSIKLWHVPRK